MSEPILRVDNLRVSYGKIEALKGISLEVFAGEIVTLIGPNGAGKTTLLKTISGLLSPTGGSITYEGRRIDGMPAEDIVRLGISHAPEGRRVFARSTVIENLMMGAYVRKDRAAVKQDIEKFLKRFPILEQRKNQLAGTLSGGEQQMLAVSRALMSKPRLLLLDEPSMGLAPTLVSEVFKIITSIHDDGATILLVEQNAAMALKVADRAYVIESGQIVLSGRVSDLAADDAVRRSYLGQE